MAKQEIIDVVDDNNIVIDRKPKDEVHRLNLKHRTSHVFLINNLNQVFLQLRAKGKKQFPNKWDISAAGHLDTGETYLEAAKRELYEELNVDLNIKDFINIGNIRASQENGNEFVEIFLAKYTGPIKLQYNEVEAGAWFDINILSKWVKDSPDKFAGGFAEVFEMFGEKK